MDSFLIWVIWMGNRLIMFYGTECHICHEIEPTIDKLADELNVKITKLEVWHDAKNAAEFQKVDSGKCGGVPFFYNEKTKKWLCGEVSYSELKKWATGK